MSMQNELSEEKMDEIIELIYSGQKVAACKRYMEYRGQEIDDMPSLLEAKKFVEQLTDKLKAQNPERFSNTKSGCLASALALAFVCSLSVYCFFATVSVIP